MVTRGIIFAGLLIFAAGSGGPASAQDSIAEPGTILNADQLVEVLVGHTFEDDSLVGNPWEETYYKDGTLQSQDGLSRSSGSYTIENDEICIQYNKANWRDYSACWQVRLRTADGTKITYIRPGRSVDGKRVD